MIAISTYWWARFAVNFDNMLPIQPSLVPSTVIDQKADFTDELQNFITAIEMLTERHREKTVS